MARRRTAQTNRTIAQVERVAKRLRADARKQARKRPLLNTLLRAANRLGELAATAAGQVEKYVHQMRNELEVARPPKRAVRRVRPRRAA